MDASQIQGCILEQRVKKKRKIAEFVWVHNVVTVRTDKVAGQCAMPYTPFSLGVPNRMATDFCWKPNAKRV